jgi:hypothetical protein
VDAFTQDVFYGGGEDDLKRTGHNGVQGRRTDELVISKFAH